MTVKNIEGWLCTEIDEMRIASKGDESASYEPGDVMVITCGSSRMVKLPSAVVQHLVAPRSRVNT